MLSWAAGETETVEVITTAVVSAVVFCCHYLAKWLRSNHESHTGDLQTDTPMATLPDAGVVGLIGLLLSVVLVYLGLFVCLFICCRC